MECLTSQTPQDDTQGAGGASWARWGFNLKQSETSPVNVSLMSWGVDDSPTDGSRMGGIAEE